MYGVFRLHLVVVTRLLGVINRLLYNRLNQFILVRKVLVQGFFGSPQLRSNLIHGNRLESIPAEQIVSFFVIFFLSFSIIQIIAPAIYR